MTALELSRISANRKREDTVKLKMSEAIQQEKK
jgi:hypothetical protein